MDHTETITTKNAQETAQFGKTLAAGIIREGTRVPRVICLYGELGMGKTTFVQGFAKGLGITTRLLSPTFIIVRRHFIASAQLYFYHMDLYRITNIHELEHLGIEEILKNPRHIVVIEWAERMESLLPKGRTDIRFVQGVAENERRIQITYDCT